MCVFQLEPGTGLISQREKMINLAGLQFCVVQCFAVALHSSPSGLNHDLTLSLVVNLNQSGWEVSYNMETCLIYVIARLSHEQRQIGLGCFTLPIIPIYHIVSLIK